MEGVLSEGVLPKGVLSGGGFVRAPMSYMWTWSYQQFLGEKQSIVEWQPWGHIRFCSGNKNFSALIAKAALRNYLIKFSPPLSPKSVKKRYHGHHMYLK